MECGRSFIRFETPLDVMFRPLKGAARYSIGLTNNFSRKGFSFESADFDISLEKVLEFKIELPGRDRFISGLGDIAWSKKSEAKSFVGVRIRKMHKESQWDILDYCYDFWIRRKQIKSLLERANCWEFKKCGREAGGILSENLGVCPASTEDRLDGVHGGKKAGRSCWAVAGTMCRDKPQGSFSKKHKECGSCDFYDVVKREEGEDFIPTAVHLRKLESV
jgi:hypothetical protein